MRKKDFEVIRGKLQVFGLGKLQDLITLLGILEREKINLKEIKEFVEFTLESEKAFRISRERQVEEMGKLAGNCPKCKTSLRIRTIHLPKGKANVHGYRSHCFCGNEECDYEKYSKEPIKILVKKMVGR